MYIKKIVLAIAIIGLLALAGFSYYIYTNIFSANTSFSEKEQAVYVPTGATYRTVIDSLRPLVKDIESFNLIAEKKAIRGILKPGSI